MIKQTFRNVYHELKIQHASCLWSNAILADQIAKICSQPTILHTRKGFYLSALYRMACLQVTDAHMTDTGIFLTIAFTGGQTQVFSHQLAADVQDRIGSTVARLLTRNHRHANKRTKTELSKTISIAKGA
jgi:hypothetical protein